MHVAFHIIFCWAKLHLKWRNAWLQFLIFTSPSLLQGLGTNICSLLDSKWPGWCEEFGFPIMFGWEACGGLDTLNMSDLSHVTSRTSDLHLAEAVRQTNDCTTIHSMHLELDLRAASINVWIISCRCPDSRSQSCSPPCWPRCAPSRRGYPAEPGTPQTRQKTRTLRPGGEHHVWMRHAEEWTQGAGRERESAWQPWQCLESQDAHWICGQGQTRYGCKHWNGTGSKPVLCVNTQQSQLTGPG